jgi:hypothetical protein
LAGGGHSRFRPPLSSQNKRNLPERILVTGFIYRLWREEDGQDIAEYAVMLAVILVIVVGNDSPGWIKRE